MCDEARGCRLGTPKRGIFAEYVRFNRAIVTKMTQCCTKTEPEQRFEVRGREGLRVKVRLDRNSPEFVREKENLCKGKCRFLQEDERNTRHGVRQSAPYVKTQFPQKAYIYLLGEGE